MKYKLSKSITTHFCVKKVNPLSGLDPVSVSVTDR
jgi:hypothetical protein